MIRSMTAFARSAGTTKWGELTCELRSVNHRYLEVHLRLSDELRYLEPRLRELFNSRLNRGRIDCSMRIQGREAVADGIDVDFSSVAKLMDAAGDIRSRHPSVGELRMVDVLHWPGVMKTEQIDADELGAAALGITAETVDELRATREREGARLSGILSERLDEVAAIVARVRQDLPTILKRFRERIEQRLGEVRNDLEPSRLEQEMVLYAQKSDVTEEVDRLAVHVDEVRQVLGRDKPVGRRLDFLMQELNREANTLGSKAVDTQLTQAAVDLKVLVEQMREQVQNVE